MDAVAFSGTGGDRLLVLGASYTTGTSYSGSSNAIVAKLNEYVGATAPDPSLTTLAVNGGSTATVSVGQSATIVVSVNLSSGTPVSGATVSLAASPSGTSIVSPNTTITDANGHASFTVQGVSAGTVTYNAVAAANGTTTTSTGSVSVTFVGVRSAAQSTAVVPSGTAGTATAVTVTVRDSQGNPVAGAASALAIAIGGTNAGAATSAISDQGGGSYSFTYVPTLVGTDSVVIQLDNTPISGSPYSSAVAAPSIVFAPAPGALPGGTIGAAYAQSLSVSGGTAPYGFTGTGLPAGLSVNAATGAITGTPTAAGTYTISVTGTDAHNIKGTASYTIVIAGQAPVAGAVSSTVAANSSANPLPLVITGGAATSVAITTAPAHGSATASDTSITYTPTAGYSGTDSFTYTATNASGTSSSATIIITVTAPTLTFSPTVGALPDGTAGTPYSQTLSVTGGTAPYSYIATGLPTGLSMSPSGAITGTPTTGGSYSVTVSATDANGATSEATYTIVVAVQAPVAGSVSTTVVANSANNSIPLNLSGGAANSVAIASAPAHGTTTTSGTFISYTPAPGYSGTDSFTYTATNAGGTSSPATVTVAVGAATLAFSPAPGALPAGIVGTPYLQTVAASGGAAPYRYSATGLPAGLSISSSGAITGTPTSVGSYSVTVSATDASGATSVGTYTIVVAVQAPIATGSSITVAANSTANSVSLALSGGTASAVVIGAAPAHGNASVSGTTVVYTPVAGYSGADSFTYTAANATGSSMATVSITVTAPTLAIAPALGTIPAGTVAAGYSAPLTTSGGTAPYRYVATGLPPGLVIDPTTGAITGTPSTAGTYRVTVTVTDSNGASGTASYTVEIAAPPPPVAADADAASVAANSSTQAGHSVSFNLSGLVTGEYDDIRIVAEPAHGTVTISRTLAMSGGGSLMPMATLAASAVKVPGQVIAVYTPAPGYAGPDSFQFVAVGAGGTSAAATASIQVIGDVPSAPDRSASTIDGEPVSIELTTGATGGPFTAAAIVDVSPADEATAAIVPGGTAAAQTFRLQVTPKPHVGGVITIRYTLSNAFATSAPGLVTVNVTARPDPTADPTVRGISDAQTEAARRFSRAQVSNFMQHAESLHGDCRRSTNGLRIASLDGGHVDGATATGAGLINADSGVAPNTSRVEDRRDPDKGRPDAGGPARCGDKVSVWTGGTVDIGVRDAVTGRSRISASTAGISAGVDVHATRGLTLGVGAGVGHDSSSIGADQGHVSADSKVIAAYVSLAPAQGAFLDAMIARGSLQFGSRRTDITAELLASGSRDGAFTTGAVSAGIDRTVGLFRWSAYGRAEYLDAKLHAFRETGAGVYDLRFDARGVRSLSGVMGFKADYRRMLSSGLLSASLRGEWQHEFTSGTSQSLDYADVTGPSFYSIQALGWAREQFTLEPGLTLSLPSGWDLGLDVGVRAAQDERAVTTVVKVRKTF